MTNDTNDINFGIYFVCNDLNQYDIGYGKIKLSITIMKLYTSTNSIHEIMMIS